MQVSTCNPFAPSFPRHNDLASVMRRRPSVLKENCCLGAGLAVLHCDTVTASPSFGSEGTVIQL